MERKISEKQIESFLRAEIKKIDGVSFKFTSSGNAGVPDRICIMPDGRVYFVEIKSQQGKLSSLQQAQIQRLRKLRQTVFVIHSKADVIEFVNFYNNRKEDKYASI